MTHNDDTLDGLPEGSQGQDESPAHDLGDTAVLNMRKNISSSFDEDRQSAGSIPAFLANVAHANADGTDTAAAPAPRDAAHQQDAIGIPDFLRHPDAARDRDEAPASEPASDALPPEEDSLVGLYTYPDDGTYLFEDSFAGPYAPDEAYVEGGAGTAHGEVPIEDGPYDIGAQAEWEADHRQEPIEAGDEQVEATPAADADADAGMGAFVASSVWRESTLAWDTPTDALSATGEFGVYVPSVHEEDEEEPAPIEPVAHRDDSADPWPDRLLWPDEDMGERAEGDNDVEPVADVATEAEAVADDVAREPLEATRGMEDESRREGWGRDVPGADLADDATGVGGEEPEERIEVLHGVPADDSFDQYDANEEYDAYEGPAGPAGPADAGDGRRYGEEGAVPVAGAHEAVAPKNRSALKRGLQITGIVVLVMALLVGGYFLGLNHFEGRFLARTTINGLDVSGLTPQEAVEALEQETADYVCTVNAGDYAGAFTGRDFALDRDEQRMADMAFSMVDPRLWPVRYLFAQRIVVDPALTFDEALLRDFVMHSVDDHNTMALPTTNARIELDEGTGLYSVEGTTSGIAVAKEPVSDAVVASVSAFEPVCTPDPEVCLHEATVQDLPAYAYAAVRANLDRTSDIAILAGGVQVATLTPEQSREWVTVNSVPEVEVDTDALKDWATYVVADAVWHRDDWSNFYLDLDAFVAGLTDRLKLGIVEGYEAPCYEELRTEGESRTLAYERGGWNSELGRYIDVDLEAQFVRLFDETGNVIWESACVSGDLYESRSTVTGVFEIYSKQMGVTLVGHDYNNDGQPDYESYVNFWMPFYGGYGLHDATWRANFGGDYFYYNGSHGCINLPYSKAEELYNITFVGEKVNVHW